MLVYQRVAKICKTKWWKKLTDDKKQLSSRAYFHVEKIWEAADFCLETVRFWGARLGGVRTCPFSCAVRLQNERCWKRVWAFHRKRMLWRANAGSDERDGKIRIWQRKMMKHGDIADDGCWCFRNACGILPLRDHARETGLTLAFLSEGSSSWPQNGPSWSLHQIYITYWTWKLPILVDELATICNYPHLDVITLPSLTQKLPSSSRPEERHCEFFFWGETVPPTEWSAARRKVGGGAGYVADNTPRSDVEKTLVFYSNHIQSSGLWVVTWSGAWHFNIR